MSNKSIIAFSTFFAIVGFAFMVWAIFLDNSAMELYGAFNFFGGYYELAKRIKRRRA